MQSLMSQETALQISANPAGNEFELLMRKWSDVVEQRQQLFV